METGVFDQFSLSDSDEPASTSTATHGGWAGGGAAASLSRRPISDENIVMLLEMGFGEEQVRRAEAGHTGATRRRRHDEPHPHIEQGKPSINLRVCRAVSCGAADVQR